MWKWTWLWADSTDNTAPTPPPGHPRSFFPFVLPSLRISFVSGTALTAPSSVVGRKGGRDGNNRRYLFFARPTANSDPEALATQSQSNHRTREHQSSTFLLHLTVTFLLPENITPPLSLLYSAQVYKVHDNPIEHQRRSAYRTREHSPPHQIINKGAFGWLCFPTLNRQCTSVILRAPTLRAKTSKHNLIWYA